MADISGIANNIKTPFFYLNVCDGVLAIPDVTCNSIIVAPMISTGTATPGVPAYVFSYSQALALFGPGSVAADMVGAYLGGNISAQVQVLPIAEGGGWVAATGTITVASGPVDATVTKYFSVGGQKFSVPIIEGMTDTQAASAIRDAYNLVPGKLCAATSSLGVVTFTALQKGVSGNDMKIFDLGYVSGSGKNDGLTYALVQFASGAGVPDLDTALLALKDCPYDCLVSAWNDVPSVESFEDFLNCTAGRWAYNRMLYGIAFFAKRGSSSQLITWSADHNFFPGSAIGFCAEQTETYWQWAACYAAAACQEACEDPARSYNGVELPCVECDTVCGSSCFSWAERELLACHGITTWTCGAGGKVLLNLPVTLLQSLNSGVRVFQPIQYVFTHMALARDLINFAKLNWDGKKIADDGTDLTRAPNTTTLGIMRAQLVSWYSSHEGTLVEDVAGFEKTLKLERDPTNPTRVNIAAFGNPVDPNLVVAMKFGLVSNYRPSGLV